MLVAEKRQTTPPVVAELQYRDEDAQERVLKGRRDRVQQTAPYQLAQKFLVQFHDLVYVLFMLEFFRKLLSDLIDLCMYYKGSLVLFFSLNVRVVYVNAI